METGRSLQIPTKVANPSVTKTTCMTKGNHPASGDIDQEMVSENSYGSHSELDAKMPNSSSWVYEGAFDKFACETICGGDNSTNTDVVATVYTCKFDPTDGKTRRSGCCIQLAAIWLSGANGEVIYGGVGTIHDGMEALCCSRQCYHDPYCIGSLQVASIADAQMNGVATNNGHKWLDFTQTYDNCDIGHGLSVDRSPCVECNGAPYSEIRQSLGQRNISVDIDDNVENCGNLRIHDFSYGDGDYFVANFDICKQSLLHGQRYVRPISTASEQRHDPHAAFKSDENVERAVRLRKLQNVSCQRLAQIVGQLLSFS